MWRLKAITVASCMSLPVQQRAQYIPVISVILNSQIVSIWTNDVFGSQCDRCTNATWRGVPFILRVLWHRLTLSVRLCLEDLDSRRSSESCATNIACIALNTVAASISYNSSIAVRSWCTLRTRGASGSSVTDEAVWSSETGEARKTSSSCVSLDPGDSRRST